MSQCCSGGSDSVATRRSSALKAADWLALAASPTFAVMAVLTGITGGDAMGLAHVSPIGGMVTMYLLMSVFHVSPWLKLLRERGRATFEFIPPGS
jgi:hypothetical protein